ncbi:MAG TPA: DUF1697 domain-containing protein [Chloroflexia bacterium]|nr:DUF1697 domain-containing protein [Chloroflexia bacterium]
MELDVSPPIRYIAFLRAINVGGHTVKMDALRTLVAELGFANVATFIASGNVIFDAPAAPIPTLETRIARHLQQALGYAVGTFIRSASELTAIAHYQPFLPADLAGDSTALYIAFLATPPSDLARQKLLALRTPADDFRIQDREIYWLCRTRMSESVFSGALLEKTIGQPATLRNSTTVQKLAAKYAVADTS